MAKTTELAALIKMLEGKSEEEIERLIKSLSEEKPPKKQSGEKRVNEFDNSPLLNANQGDIEIDKKLWANRSASYRENSGKLHYVEINCSKCNRLCNVKSDLIFRMPGGEYSYTCDNCIGRK